MEKNTQNDMELGARASREGHEYHVAWAAKVALKLIYPNSELTSISIEGFNIEGSDDFSDDAMEIADLVQYYGGETTASAKKIEVLQFKYSPTQVDKELTASNLHKTLKKFISTQSDFESDIGYQLTEQKTEFIFVSNRPVGKNLQEALKALRNGGKAKGHVQTQLNTLKDAINLKGRKLQSFLDRLSIEGKNTTRQGITGETLRILSHLSDSPEPVTRLRLLELQDLLRQKAGCKGASNNCVKQVDILGSLGVDEPEDLYPTPDSFTSVPVILERGFTIPLIDKIFGTKRPFIIHGSGGSGKTVVMQSLKTKLSASNETILFDGFGGGMWRAPSDQRHLAKKSLLHIINSLAAKNLCDLILPSIGDGLLLQTAIKRLNQAITTVLKTKPEGNIVLLLDAIDHAGMRADSEKCTSFAKELLKELDINPVDGVHVIASCRTERKYEAYDDVDYPDFEIPPFCKEEIQKLLSKRAVKLSSEEESILIASSGGNPRCIDIMLKNDDLLNTPKVNKDGKLLDALLEEHFEQAIEHAKSKGSFAPEAESFIVGLRLLPPPVPIIEMARIFNVPLQSIQSFISDLHPLIESSQYGLIFRDEPTETLAKNYADKNLNKTHKFIQGLKEQQSKSSYCARALPSLLIEFDRPDDLIELAFSDVFPDTATSTVAKRNIKLSRISAAIIGCADAKKYDDVFTLLIEASTIANGTQRSDRYILDFPDLAVASGDPEVRRRVHETKSAWRGKRVSSQSLALAFEGIFDEATAKGRLGVEWLNWGVKQVDKNGFHRDGLYETDDWYGAIYALLLNGEIENILHWLDKTGDVTYAFNFLNRVFDFLILHSKESELAKNCLNNIVKRVCNSNIISDYCLCAIILKFPLSIQNERKFISILSRSANLTAKSETRFGSQQKEASLNEALLCIAIRAMNNNQRNEARKLLRKTYYSKPKEYEFGHGSSYHGKCIFLVIYTAINSILSRRKPNVGDFLPEEVWEKLPKSTFSKGPKKIEEAIQRLFSQGRNGKNSFDHQRRNDLLRTLDERVRPLVRISHWISSLINPHKAQTVEATLQSLKEMVTSASDYPYRDQKYFLTKVGLISIMKGVTQSKNWTSESAKQYCEWVESSELKNQSDLTNIISELSSETVAEKAALKLTNYTAKLIKQETDIMIKIDNLAYLARAIWHASKYEAGEIFKQGIGLADKLGSDDYFEIQSLIHCAQNYNGNLFSDESLHNFNRICELNFPYETEKFIWVGYGKALAKIGGVKAIPIVSRLADRGVISLEYTLAPLLSYLIEYKKLDVKEACPLIGLGELSEYWNWDLSDMLEFSFSELSHSEKESFAVWIAKEYDRAYASTPPAKPLKKLNELLNKEQINIPGYRHLDGLEEEKEPHINYDANEITTTFNDGENNRPIDFDPTDFDALNSDIIEELKISSKPYTVRRRCVHIIKEISRLDDAIKFTKLIPKLEQASLEDILKLFDKLRKQWGDISNALGHAIKDGTLEAISRSPVDFIGEDFQLGSLLRDICINTAGKEKDALCSILKGLGTELNELQSCQWMHFAASLSGYISDSALEIGLKRYLQVRVDDVPDNLGDPKWSSIYEPPSSSEDIVVKFLWNQLGSPYTNLRWRAAHAVIRNVEFRNLSIIEKLIECFENDSALPFHSPDLPFYEHHARLWLLISLSKAAFEYPSIVGEFSKNILRLAELSGDHCLQKFYAVKTLEIIKDSDLDFPCEQELEEQRKLITSIGTTESDAGSSTRANSYMGRPENEPELGVEFYFDYDFKKNKVDQLGSLFDIDTWKVCDDMTSVIAEWDDNITGFHQCSRDISSDERYYDEQQPYGYYLSYHSLFVTAGKYAKNHLVVKRCSDDTWEGWLKPYSLLKPWLSDNIDYFPTDLPSSGVKLESEDGASTMSDRLNLATQITGKESLNDAKEITLSGTWSGMNGVKYEVSSALIEPSKVRELTYALMIQKPFYNYLPVRSDYGCPWSIRGLQKPLYPIVSRELSDDDNQMDEFDPYGIKGANEWLKPSNDIISEQGLTFTDIDGKKWISSDKSVVFSSRVWGVKSGRGRYRHENRGEDLKVSRKELISFLKRRKKSLVTLVKAQKYHEHKKLSENFVNKSAVIVLSANDNLRVVQKLPKALKNMANKMSEFQQCDFMDCYEVVLKYLKK